MAFGVFRCLALIRISETERVEQCVYEWTDLDGTALREPMFAKRHVPECERRDPRADIEQTGGFRQHMYE